MSVELLQQEVSTLKEIYSKDIAALKEENKELKKEMSELKTNQTNFLILQTEFKGQLREFVNSNAEVKKSIADLTTLLNTLQTEPGKRWNHMVYAGIGGCIVVILNLIYNKLIGK